MAEYGAIFGGAWYGSISDYWGGPYENRFTLAAKRDGCMIGAVFEAKRRFWSN